MTDEEMENLRQGMAQIIDFHAGHTDRGPMPDTIALSTKHVTWMLDEIERLRAELALAIAAKVAVVHKEALDRLGDL